MAIRYMTMLIIAVGAIWATACSSSNKRPDLHLHIVVKGRVVDAVGQPGPGALVQAWLGLDLDGRTVETDSNGDFVANAFSPFWFKGCPGLKASAKGYSDELIYFDCWDQGEREFERMIVLKSMTKKTGG